MSLDHDHAPATHQKKPHLQLHSTIKSSCLFTLLLLGLSGCVNNMANLKLPYGGTGQELTMVDKRPANQKSTGLMSLNLSNCKYGSKQIGDELQSPSRIEILRNHLAFNLTNKLAQKEVTVKNFTIHINDAAGLRGMLSNSMGGGILSDAIIDKKTVGCSFDDLYGGYSLDENPNKYAPIITVIDIEIDGKTYHSRTVRSLEGAYFGRKNPKWDQLIQSAITETADILVENFNNKKYIVIK